MSIFSLVLLPVAKEFGLSSIQLGLLTTVPAIGSLLGIVVMSWCLDIFGRKPTIMFSYVLCCIACLITAFSDGIIMLAAGKMLEGVGIKSGVIGVSIYMSELAPAESRGSLVSLEELYINIGILFATAAAWLLMGMESVSWRVYVGSGILPPLVALFGMILLKVPESPRYLHMWGRKAEAEAVLRSALTSEKEVSDTLNSWAQDRGSMHKKSPMQHLQDVKSLPADPGFRLASYCWIARAGSGIAVISAYFTLLMQGIGEEASLRMFTIGATCKTLALLPSVLWFIDSQGRKQLFLTSAVVCCLAIAAAACLQLNHASLAIVACCVVLYQGGFSIGYGPVVWTYCFEILPQEQRGRAALLSMLPGDILSGLMLLTFPVIIEANAGFAYAALAVSNLAAVLFFYMGCPETKGVLLEKAHDVA